MRFISRSAALVLILTGCSSFGTLTSVATGGRTNGAPRGVTVLRKGKPQSVTTGMSLEKGDIISTAPDTAAELRFEHATALLMPSTKIAISNPSIFEWFGEVWINGLFETHTKYVVAASKGTKYLVRQGQGTEPSEVIVLEGAVGCQAPDGRFAGFTVTQNRKVTIARGDNKSGAGAYAIHPGTISDDELTEIRGRLQATGLVDVNALDGQAGGGAFVQTAQFAPASGDVGPDGARFDASPNGPSLVFPRDVSRVSPFGFALIAADKHPSPPGPSEAVPLGVQFRVEFLETELGRKEPVQIWSQGLATVSSCPKARLVLAVDPRDPRSGKVHSRKYLAATHTGNQAMAAISGALLRQLDISTVFDFESAEPSRVSWAAQFMCASRPNATVPALTGLLFHDADQRLRAAGLKRGLLRYLVGAPGEPADKVVSQGIDPGVLVPGGTEIQINMAGGPRRGCEGRTGYYCTGYFGSDAMKCEGEKFSAGFVSCEEPNGLVRCDADGRASFENGHLLCE